MNRLAVAAVVVLLSVTAGAVFVGDLAPGGARDGPSSGLTVPDTNATTTGTVTESEGTTARETTTAVATATETASDSTTTTGTDAGYNFTIERVEECGSTCRDVTARLANERSEAREDVRATTRVYADGDLLWRGNETVGTLTPGEAHTSTKRVELGLAGAMAIQNNDGYVTIVTVVRSADGTVRFEDRRKVG